MNYELINQLLSPVAPRQFSNEDDVGISDIIEGLKNFKIFDDGQHFDLPDNYQEPRPVPEHPVPRIIPIKDRYENIHRRNNEKSKFQLFLRCIFPGMEYSPETITNIYNYVFNSNISHSGFGRLKEVKQFFHVFKRRTKIGIDTIYILK